MFNYSEFFNGNVEADELVRLIRGFIGANAELYILYYINNVNTVCWFTIVEQWPLIKHEWRSSRCRLHFILWKILCSWKLFIRPYFLFYECIHFRWPPFHRTPCFDWLGAFQLNLRYCVKQWGIYVDFHSGHLWERIWCVIFNKYL